MLGPGLLVAATGVGAGDLATAAFTGSQLGTGVLWAVVLGAFLKFVLNEGLARWQIATGETLLAGAVRRLGRPVRVLFPLYLLPWTFFVGSALASACGVTLHAMLPVCEDPVAGKQAFGVAASLLGIVLVRAGGFRLFERTMAGSIAVMFVTVVATAVLLRPDALAVARGFLPQIPDAGGDAAGDAGGGGLGWTVALMGGVGGTLTVLCYGYWIRAEGRDRPEDLAVMRLDLGVSYAMTAMFGIAMVVIGSTITAEGEGAGLVVALAERLSGPLGPVGRWAFLVGAFGAVFSSLLGVWQSVPYVFADFWRLVRGEEAAGARAVDTAARPYRLYLYAIGTVPLLGLFASFREIQRAYAIIGALFIPLLAVVLLALNGRASVVGSRFRNRVATSAVLVASVVLFLVFGWLEVR